MSKLRTKAAVQRALDIILVAATQHRGNGREDEVAKLAGTAMALAWMLNDGSEPGTMFQKMIETCDAHDATGTKPRKHVHRSAAPIGDQRVAEAKAKLDALIAAETLAQVLPTGKNAASKSGGDFMSDTSRTPSKDGADIPAYVALEDCGCCVAVIVVSETVPPCDIADFIRDNQDDGLKVELKTVGYARENLLRCPHKKGKNERRHITRSRTAERRAIGNLARYSG